MEKKNIIAFLLCCIGGSLFVKAYQKYRDEKKRKKRIEALKVEIREILNAPVVDREKLEDRISEYVYLI